LKNIFLPERLSERGDQISEANEKGGRN